MSETAKVVEAEKGRNLSPQNLHIRLRVVEVVVLVSLVLNVIQGYIAIHSDKQMKNQMNDVKQESDSR